MLLVPPIGWRRKQLAASYRSTGSTTATDDAFSWPDKDIGVNISHPKRRALVIVECRINDTTVAVPTSVHVGGRAGVQRTSTSSSMNYGNPPRGGLTFWEVDITGLPSTALVEVTFGVDQMGCSFALYEIIDGEYVHSNGSVDGGTSAPDGVTQTINTVAGCVVIAGGIGLIDGSAPSLSGVTQRVITTVASNIVGNRDVYFMVGDNSAPSTPTHDVGVTIGADSRSLIAGVSYRQA